MHVFFSFSELTLQGGSVYLLLFLNTILTLEHHIVK